MGRRQKVLGFFDVFGPNFDPSLGAFALSAIVGTGILLNTIVLPKNGNNPLYTSMKHMPTATQLDTKLVVGALIFGIGWGLSGYCPAPGIINVVALDSSAIQWMVGCLIGNVVTKKYISKFI